VSEWIVERTRAKTDALIDVLLIKADTVEDIVSWLKEKGVTIETVSWTGSVIGYINVGQTITVRAFNPNIIDLRNA
jgi:hypothetical protein